MRTTLLLVCLWLAPPASAAAQTTVSLNASALVAANAPIRLADIAAVTGPEQATLGEITIIERAPAPGAAAPWVRIDLGTVRRVLEIEKVNMGRTVLRGSVCTARIAAEPAPAPLRPEANPAAVPAPAPSAPSGPTIRAYIAASLARLYRVQPEDLRLSFDARDQAILDSTPGTNRVSVEPTASGSSGAMTVRTRQYAGDHQVRTDGVSVRVLIRRAVLTASASIERGRPIDPAALNQTEQWLSPAASTPATIEEASGRTARLRISAGQVITRELLESPYVIQKGDMVEVHCLSGAIQVKASRARAQEKARDGDMVTLKLEGASKTFRARMDGAGKAVLVLDDGAVR